jgi:sec-independent protein translocase protein TatB
MFDVGFSEIFVIALVALIVIGPERLPKVARTLGLLFGRMQRYVNDVKADISREMELDELRKLQTTVEDAARSIEQTVNKEINTAESELNSIAASAADAAPALSSPDIAPTPAVAGAPVTTPATEPAPAPVAAPTAQLELGLDTAEPAARKQA